MPAETTRAEGLAGRYANALFELAEEGKVLDRVADDLKALSAMLDGSADLRHLVRSPVIAREEQAKAMVALAEKAGLHDLTRRFLAVLAQNRRLFALADMIAAYLGLIAGRRGEVTARVTSAQPLNERQLGALSEALRRAVGAKVALDARVDPGLLGGLVVKVGSRMVDSSLSTKLLRLRLAMKGVG